MPVGIYVRKKVQFCPHGHDTFICGRDSIGYCMNCRIKRLKEYHSTHKELEKQKAKERRQQNPQKTKISDRTSNLKRVHGITIEDYDKMFKNQNGKCAICGTIDPKGKGNFHVDHDHITDQIRGLLCLRCNVLLGYAKESPKILRQAVLYLKRYEKPKRIKK